MEEIDGPETIRRRVIFLDIDGVLQPPSRQTRFKHDLEELRRSLAERFDDETYLSMDKYDLGAVYHDWDSGAVERLGRLCADCNARIVISSDWRRSNSTRRLQALFRIHDLHGYVIDATKEIDGPPHYRAGEVKEYLDSHPEIERFVVARLLRFPGYSQTRQKAKDRFAWAGFRFQEQREGHDRRTRPRCTRY